MRCLIPSLLSFALFACGGDAGESESSGDSGELVDARDEVVHDGDSSILADADDASASEADDPEESEESDDDVTDAVTDEDADDEAGDFEFRPQACVHALDEKRPRITKSSQDRTRRVLRHVGKRLGAHADFKKLLALVALRESSYQSGLVHRLSPDLNASYVSWRKMSQRYENNPFADDPTVWQTYGLFGMNSNYFTLLWDKEADPRVLCDPIVDILLYRRAALRALRKMNSGAIRCKDANGESFDVTLEPTWYNIHRAVSGGKICPTKHEERAASMRKYFVGRATRSGLDPDGIVTTKMLGAEPSESVDGEPWEDQEHMVMGLWEDIEAEEAEEAEQAATREAQIQARAEARKAKRGGGSSE